MSELSDGLLPGCDTGPTSHGPTSPAARVLLSPLGQPYTLKSITSITLLFNANVPFAVSKCKHVDANMAMLSLGKSLGKHMYDFQYTNKEATSPLCPLNIHLLPNIIGFGYICPRNFDYVLAND